jgi:hypothetical protein
MRDFLALGAYSPSSQAIQNPAALRIEIVTLFITLGKPRDLMAIIEWMKTKIYRGFVFLGLSRTPSL